MSLALSCEISFCSEKIEEAKFRVIFEIEKVAKEKWGVEVA